MSKIKGWLYRRSRSFKKSEVLEKSSVADMLSLMSSELGQEASANLNALVKQNANSITCEMAKNMEVLEFVEKYLGDPKFSQEVNDSLVSNFHRSHLKKSVEQVAISIAKILPAISMSDLSKTVKPTDWTRVTKKQEPDAELSVDHKPHLTQFPVHPEYSKMLSSTELEYPHHKLDENGISAKMVHEIQDDASPYDQNLYMAKPYHKKLESATKSWVKKPITGWATMATKAIFNAGKIGDLAEDVSAHEHEGVPLTVHKFAPDHRPIGKLSKYQRGGWGLEGQVPNPVDVHKIGVMDYLMNNLDRHDGNLMVGTYTDPRGNNPLLAIDHERNFQYNKPIWSRNRMARVSGVDSDYKNTIAKESPWSYIKGSSLNTANNSPNGWYSHEDLVDWWNENAHGIKGELENQLGSVKDETMRKHIRENFSHRWHNMNNWATKMKNDPESAHMYAPSSLGEAFDHTRMIAPEIQRITSGALKQLPKNKRDALFTIADMVNKKPKLTYKQTTMLSNTIDKILDEMTPEEAAEAFKSLAGNPYLSTKAVKDNPDVDPKNKMLRHFWEMRGYDANHEPIYKYPHMEAMAQAIESMPEDKRGMLSSWSDSYRRRLDEARKVA